MQPPREIQIFIENRLVTRTELADHADDWAGALLEKAYLNKSIAEPRCMCQPLGVPMHVAKAKYSSYYLLKRNPNTGQNHAPGCESYSGLPPDLDDIYKSGVVSQSKHNGIVAVRLDAPSHTMRYARGSANATEVSIPVSYTGKRQPVMTLRGYMHLLWETAGLNRYDPVNEGSRRYGSVRTRLVHVMEDHHASGFGNLAERTLVPTPLTSVAMRNNEEGIRLRHSSIQAQLAEFNDKVKLAEAHASPNQKPVLLMLGEVQSVTRVPHTTHPLHRTQFGPVDLIAPRGPLSHMRLHLKCAPWDMEIRDYDNILEGLAKQYRGRIADCLVPPEHERERTKIMAPNDAHLFILVGVQVMHPRDGQARDYLKAVFAAPLMCNRNYIPIESEYERQVADLLVTQKRRFVKPLRYDARDKTRPDFVLHDTAVPHPCEVFGFFGPLYEARKRLKIDMATFNNLPLWWWDAVASPNVIPPFPLPVGMPVGAPQNPPSRVA